MYIILGADSSGASPNRSSIPKHRHHAHDAVWCLTSKNRLDHFDIVQKSKQYFIQGRSPATLMIHVRILLKSTVFSLKFVFEMNENKQKRQVFAHFLKTRLHCWLTPNFMCMMVSILKQKNFMEWIPEQPFVVPSL